MVIRRSTLKLSAQDQYTTIVEPWANEFVIAPGIACEIVALHPKSPPSFELEVYRGMLIVTVLESGSTFEFWRNGERELEMPVAIP